MSDSASFDSTVASNLDASQNSTLSKQADEVHKDGNMTAPPTAEVKGSEGKKPPMTMEQLTAALLQMRREKLEDQEKLEHLDSLFKEEVAKKNTPKLGPKATALAKRRGLKRGSSDIESDDDDAAPWKRFREDPAEASDYLPDEDYKMDSDDEDVLFFGSAPVKSEKEVPKKSKGGLAASIHAPLKSSSSSTTDLSSEISSSPPVTSAKRGPGRPRKDNSAGNRSMLEYYPSTDSGSRRAHGSANHHQYEPRTNYVITFGKHTGRPIQHLENWELNAMYYMPNVRKSHPDFFEAANVEMDRRCLESARRFRAEKLGGKGRKMFGGGMM